MSTEVADSAGPQATGETSIPQITLSLVSHTNVGKTSLARTLLRRDVGQVLDQAHVTEEAEIFPLITTAEGRLLLSDTPGFGDSARLLKRIRRADTPVLWFLQQSWDRFTDRPFWCSQQAALNVRHEADVVLYLVNATEEPDEAGYVDYELELLQWLGVPVWILLNQTGDTSFHKQPLQARLDRWRRHTETFHVVRGVGALDAYSRCWVEEDKLLRDLQGLLEDDKQDLMEDLRAAWNDRGLDVMGRSIDALAKYLSRAGLDREQLPSRRPSRQDREAAMEALGVRAVRSTEDLMTELLALHGLEGTAGLEIDRQLDAFAIQGADRLDPERSALLGGVVSGAVGGLAADLMAGGLTFGGGVLAGAILGALGAAGLAKGYQLVRGDKVPAVAWSEDFLRQLTVQGMLRYLAVAHFGRGRGDFQSEDASKRWLDAVASVLRAEQSDWDGARRRLAAQAETLDPEKAWKLLRPAVDQSLRKVLLRGYPEARELLLGKR